MGAPGRPALRIFISYASDDRRIAEKIATRLQLEDHHVFFDTDGLQASEGYDRQIREWIRDCDLMIFLISPDSVAPGRYTLTELQFAKQRWRNVTNHLLGVIVRDTEIDTIPAVLSALQVEKPGGNIEAEVIARVEKIAAAQRRVPRRVGMAIGIVVAALAVLFVLSSIRPGPPPGPISACADPVLNECRLPLASRICSLQQTVFGLINDGQPDNPADSAGTRKKVYVYTLPHARDDSEADLLRTVFADLRNAVGSPLFRSAAGDDDVVLPGPMNVEKAYEDNLDAMLIVDARLDQPADDESMSRYGSSTFYTARETPVIANFSLPNGRFEMPRSLHAAAIYYAQAVQAVNAGQPERAIEALTPAREQIVSACAMTDNAS